MTDILGLNVPASDTLDFEYEVPNAVPDLSASLPNHSSTLQVDSSMQTDASRTFHKTPRMPTFPNAMRRRRSRTLDKKILPWKRPEGNRKIQLYHHKLGMMVLCFREMGYCLTDGVTSYVRENDPDMEGSLVYQLSRMNFTTLYVTDEASLIRWKTLQRNVGKNHRLCALTTINLKLDAGFCPTCHKNCMRWAAICALNNVRKVKVDPIPHHAEL